MKNNFFIISILCTLLCVMISCHKDEQVKLLMRFTLPFWNSM